MKLPNGNFITWIIITPFGNNLTYKLPQNHPKCQNIRRICV